MRNAKKKQPTARKKPTKQSAAEFWPLGPFKWNVKASNLPKTEQHLVVCDGYGGMWEEGITTAKLYLQVMAGWDAPDSEIPRIMAFFRTVLSEEDDLYKVFPTDTVHVLIPEGMTKDDALRWIDYLQGLISEDWDKLTSVPEMYAVYRANVQDALAGKPVDDEDPQTWPLPRYQAAMAAIRRAAGIGFLRLADGAKDALLKDIAPEAATDAMTICRGARKEAQAIRDERRRKEVRR